MGKMLDVPSSKCAQTMKGNEGKETGTVLPVFNKKKKQWETPGGRCFDTMLKAERHLKTI